MTRMKIVLTNNFFEPLATGSTHFTRELAGQLVRNGHDVLVITATPAASGDQRPASPEFPVDSCLRLPRITSSNVLHRQFTHGPASSNGVYASRFNWFRRFMRAVW